VERGKVETGEASKGSPGPVRSGEGAPEGLGVRLADEPRSGRLRGQLDARTEMASPGQGIRASVELEGERYTWPSERWG
jgi:hypothetical protein